MKSTNGIRIEGYTLYTNSGIKIRRATKVVFPDGYTFRFMEHVNKDSAIAQASKHRQKMLQDLYRLRRVTK